MIEIKKLDVTQLAPQKKHPTIFEWFDNTNQGDAFIIHNDHDPLPLFYQLKAERGEIFDWEYLEKGPRIWEIMITKKILDKVETIGEMAGRDLRVAEAFKKLGLEFCCDGNKPLSEACKDVGINIEDAKKAIAEISKKPVSFDKDYNAWKLDFLADYIVNIHHSYVENERQPLIDLAEKINKVHGDKHPELAEIKEQVNSLFEKMIKHQQEEETVLFPFIKDLVRAKNGGEVPEISEDKSVKSPVDMMLHDHKVVATHIHNIERLSDGYKVPSDGCESYKLFFYKLNNLDNDLHQHIHLENNILFPKAIKIEKELSVNA